MTALIFSHTYLRFIFILIISGFLAFILMGLSFFQPNLNIEGVFSQSDSTQIFYPSSNGRLSESHSSRQDIYQGMNVIKLQLPGLPRQWVRWDPFNGQGSFDVRNMYVTVSGLAFSIASGAVSKNNEIVILEYKDGNIHVETIAGATDPSLRIDIPSESVLKVQIVTFIILSMLISFILIRTRVLSLSLVPAFKQSYFVAGFSAFSLIVISFIVGTIAVGNGTGWDGGAYIAHVELLANGVAVGDDPYRMSRMGGFFPVIIAAGYGLSRETLISFQILINIFTVSIALAYFHDFLRIYGINNCIALISTATLLFSWPVLVLPVYYPILSDHLVLAIACLSLWLWVRQFQNWLYILCLWTPWVMPLLVLVPWVLTAIPFKSNSPSKASDKTNGHFGLSKNTSQIMIFLILAIPSLIYAWQYLVLFTDESILAHAGVKAGLPELRIWSSIAVCLSITAIAWVWALLLNSKELLLSVKVASFAKATLFVALSYLIMKLGLDWSKGFKGPPIIANVFIQSLSAPFKPYIAHVLYFGPVVLLALSSFFLRYFRRIATPWPLIVLFAGFLPVLAIGSESRQWLAVFPILVALFALSEQPLRHRVICLLFGIILCLPAFGLLDAVNHASTYKESFLSSNWQYYFGRQGPWMSPGTYMLGMALTFLFLLILFFLNQNKVSHEDV
jgi:hypothetical protein